MSNLKRCGRELLDGLLKAKSRYLQWQLQTQADKSSLKTARALSNNELQGRLARQRLALEHELALMKTRHKTELTMLRIRSKKDIRDYREYLDSLDRLKITIADKYRHLPEAMTFMIHHHAKQLLNEMWESEDLQHKIDSELRLIQFMSRINDDILAASENAAHDRLPIKTLEWLNK